MKHQVLQAISRVDVVKAHRVAMIARLAAGFIGTALALVEPASAQSLKQTGINIFTTMYALVGVVGAIACLVSLLNWITGNWLGREDPRKTFFTAAFGTGCAFGVVALIQFIKGSVGADASGINNL
jgi:hypothetical protein